jgi:manganese-dependent inorganic pyrophosphatase
MKILVTAGMNPDLDGLSSALGYAELLTHQGKDCVAGFEGKPQLDAQFLLDQMSMSLPHIPDNFDEVVLVDLGAKVYAPRVVQKAPELVIEVIDHRILHKIEMEFPAVRKVNIEQVGACATMITEYLYTYNVLPSKPVATMLYAAIHSNTLNLKAGVTTDRDHAAVAALASSYTQSQELIAAMFTFRTKLNAEQLEFALENDFDANGESSDGNFGIAQIEALDARAFFDENRQLIHHTLRRLKSKEKLDYVFLSVPSIQQGINYLYAVDEATGAFLHKYFVGHLDSYEDQGAPGILVKTTKLLLRKEIKPMFQQIPSTIEDRSK